LFLDAFCNLANAYKEKGLVAEAESAYLKGLFLTRYFNEFII
jgi:hypothetical protein